MPSQIDDTLPVYGSPTTQSVRDNFGIAKNEISDLQSRTVGFPFLALSGGTLTGPLNLQGPPATNNSAATKSYVDQAVAAQALYRGTYAVASNSPALDAISPQNGYSYICTTVNPTVAEALTVALPPLTVGTMISNGDSLHYSSASGWAIVKGSALTIDVTDATYVHLAGSTMTGGLILSGAPTTTLQAATKGYVDGAVGGITTTSIGALSLSGGTMTGPIVLSGAPTTALQATPKQYVDTSISIAIAPLAPLASPVLTGTPTAPTAATVDNSTQIATTAFVKAQAYAPLASPAFTGIPTSTTPPAADNTQRIATTAWVRSQYLQLSGGTLTGGVAGTTFQGTNFQTLPGANAGFGFNDRASSSFNWVWYSSGNEAYLGNTNNGTLYRFGASGSLTVGSGGIAAGGNISGAAIIASSALQGASLSVSGNINGLDVGVRNLNASNITTSGYISASGNVSGLDTAFRTVNASGGLNVTAGGANITGSLTINTGSLAVSNGALYSQGANSGIYLYRSDSPDQYMVFQHINGYLQFYFSVAGAANFSFLYNGDFYISGQGYKPGGGVWAQQSDRRLKRDITDYVAGLTEICALRPVAYRFNGLAGTPDDDRTFHGVIADEASLVMPEMVGSTMGKLNKDDEEETELLTVNATPMLWAMVNAIRQLAERLDHLEGVVQP